MNEQQKLKVRIELAKKIAEKDYNDNLKRHGTFNPKFKRKWREMKHHEHGTVSYAFDGTPDKAFVFVIKDWRVVAARADGSIIKIFGL